MDYVLGLDAGNTKTIAIVAQRDGTVAGSGRAGCGDIYGAGSPENALAAVEAAIDGALASTGLTRRALESACFSMAGADWPEDFALIRAELESRGLRGGDRLQVYNDALGALRAGSPDGFGVAVACGTGAATGARAPNGRLWHSSYWQQTQGAGELGHKTLRAVYQAELGLEPSTSLTGRVLEFFGLATVEDVLHHMTARVQPPGPRVSRLARALLDEAAAGDSVACRIVQQHGVALGDYAVVAARQVGLDTGPVTLVLTGGVLRHHSNALSAALVERVRADVPGVQPVASRFEPVAGAVLFALEAAGVTIDAPLLNRLGASLPPAALFET